VREVIEEGFDVSVEDDVETRPVKLKDPLDSRVAVTIGPEAKDESWNNGSKIGARRRRTTS
jgi:hypothetical protein